MSRREDTASKLPPSLANRLGPSPGLHGRVCKRYTYNVYMHGTTHVAVGPVSNLLVLIWTGFKPTGPLKTIGWL